MNIVDGIVGNTFIAIDSEKQAMRCDQIQEEGKLALTVSLKNSHRFGRSLSEAIKYDYSYVVECILSTGDSFRATSGLLLMDMWGDWITVLRSEGIPLFSYDFSEDSKQAKDFLFIEKVNFLPLPEIIFDLKTDDPSQNFVVLPKGSDGCDYTKGIVVQSLFKQ